MKSLIKKQLEKFVFKIIWNTKGYFYRKKIEKFIRRNKKSSKNHLNPKKIKIAFVSTWFGKEINGGAETECYNLATGLAEKYDDLEISVITTTLQDFGHDWNTPVHKEGQYNDGKIKIYRFDPEKPDRKFFHKLNGLKLMEGGTEKLKKKLQIPLPMNFTKKIIQQTGLKTF